MMASSSSTMPKRGKSEGVLYPGGPQTFDEHIKNLRRQLHSTNLPMGGQETTSSLLQDISKAVIRAHEPTFFGFVTGGVTPMAAQADQLVTEIDANVQVHLPDISIATDVEHVTMRWLLELVNFDEGKWRHRSLTTGATASNIIGLICGRDYVVQSAAARKGIDVKVSDHGLLQACIRCGVEGIQILTSGAHSSLRKAASVAGLGIGNVVDVACEGAALRLDLKKLEEAIVRPNWLSIVAISAGEVNTGLFATTGEDMARLRKLCDEHGAWIHVDAAFGLLARVLDKEEYPSLVDGVAGIELADSVAGDAHKLFNVPYDCGIFFSRHLDLAASVMQNPGAVYLSSMASGSDVIPSPLHIGIENSRRFRALSLFASLHAYGRQGYENMLQRQIAMARRIARFIASHHAYELLPAQNRSVPSADTDPAADIFMVVLFRATDDGLNAKLVEQINNTRNVWVSGTAWEGKPAARIAVANWQVDPAVHGQLVEEILQSIASQ